jgi:hypothetical protein
MVVHTCSPLTAGRQEGDEFEANLGYITRSYLKKKKNRIDNYFPDVLRLL